jgi:hypothetical protein
MLNLTSYQGVVRDGVIRLRDIRLPEGTPVVVQVAATPTGTAIHDQERKQRAIAAAGRFHSGLADLSIAHDRYLSEAYRE